MRALQRLAPAGPLLPLLQARLDPFGQLRRPFQRLRSELAHAFVCQPLRQRIDRLPCRQAPRLVERQHMVGMHDLQPIAIGIQLP